MVEIEITPSAIEDIKAIIDFVYERSPQNAEKLKDELLQKIYSLNQFPERGKIVREIGNSDVRDFLLPGKASIITVHHSARLISNNPNLLYFFD